MKHAMQYAVNQQMAPLHLTHAANFNPLAFVLMNVCMNSTCSKAIQFYVLTSALEGKLSARVKADGSESAVKRIPSAQTESHETFSAQEPADGQTPAGKKPEERKGKEGEKKQEESE